MTTNISAELRKALVLACRTTVEMAGARLYAAGEGDESGGEITPEMRDDLLAKVRTGAYVALDVDILAYEQRPGVANRNFVRFRDGNMIALGASGKGKPFLRDHAQRDSLAVAGKILTSKTTKLADGHYEMRMRVRLTASWAVELALRGLLFAVSIGWEPTGPVECSACAAPVYTKCYHWPGDRVTETPQSDGTKKFVRDRNGDLTVEWIYTQAELIETSMCPIGGVKLAGFDGVRAALAASFPDDVEGDGLSRASDFDHRSSAPEPALTPEPSNMNTAPIVAATLAAVVVMTEAQHAHYARLSAADQESFAAKTSAERDAIVAGALAADPVVHKTKSGLEIRKSHGDIALMLAKQGDVQADALEAQRLALAAQTDATALAVLRSRAGTEIGALAGDLETKVAVLRAVDSIADEPTRTKVLAMLKGAQVAMAELGRPKGANPGGDPVLADKASAFTALEAALAPWCKTKNISAVWTEGLAAFAGSVEGKPLVDAYNATL